MMWGVVSVVGILAGMVTTSVGARILLGVFSFFLSFFLQFNLELVFRILIIYSHIYTHRTIKMLFTIFNTSCCDCSMFSELFDVAPSFIHLVILHLTR